MVGATGSFHVSVYGLSGPRCQGIPAALVLALPLFPERWEAGQRVHCCHGLCPRWAGLQLRAAVLSPAPSAGLQGQRPGGEHGLGRQDLAEGNGEWEWNQRP